MHTGTADFGHYYSFIKISEDKWHEFNDSLIKEFDPKNIESECYGGQNSGENDTWGWGRFIPFLYESFFSKISF